MRLIDACRQIGEFVSKIEEMFPVLAGDVKFRPEETFGIIFTIDVKVHDLGEFHFSSDDLKRFCEMYNIGNHMLFNPNGIVTFSFHPVSENSTVEVPIVTNHTFPM